MAEGGEEGYLGGKTAESPISSSEAASSNKSIVMPGPESIFSASSSRQRLAQLDQYAEPLGLSILSCKVFVRHREIHNSFYEGDYERDESPTEEQVQDPLTNFAEIKLVNTNTAKEKGK